MITKRISLLLSTAFQNPEGKIVTIVMNQTDKATPYFVWVNGNAAEVNALPHSISIIIF